MQNSTTDTLLLLLDHSISKKAYCRVDLSDTNPDLIKMNIADPKVCQEYIDAVLERNRAKVAYGGYLERRMLYTSERFSKGKVRNIHLGVDFWCGAGTKVVTPLDGTVHSFKNNDDSGNYGPTIILEHRGAGGAFYTLYGHLSLESLEGLHIGKRFAKGSTLATLGETAINVNYAPHLHFQVIIDLGDFEGDYPGVCSDENLSFFTKNCPNPKVLLTLEYR